MKRFITILMAAVVALSAIAADTPPADVGRRPPMFGMKVAYLHKFYRGRYHNGTMENLNCWGLPGSESGIHFGITVEPWLGRGVSIATGVFYEYFMSQNHITRWKAHEHILYIPLHAKYSLQLGRGMAVYALAGPALSWGLNIKLSHGSDDDLEPHFDTMGWPRRLQCLAEGGIGFAWRKVGLEVLYGVGLLKEDSMPQGLWNYLRQQKLTVQLEVKF